MEVMPRLWEMRLAALLCRYLNVANGSLEHGCEGFRIQFLTELVLVGRRDFEDPDLSWDETSIGINKSRCRRKLGLLAQRVGLCGSDLSVTTIRAWHAVFERHERSLALTGRCGKPSFVRFMSFPERSDHCARHPAVRLNHSISKLSLCICGLQPGGSWHSFVRCTCQAQCVICQKSTGRHLRWSIIRLTGFLNTETRVVWSHDVKCIVAGLCFSLINHTTDQLVCNTWS